MYWYIEYSFDLTIFDKIYLLFMSQKCDHQEICYREEL